METSRGLDTDHTSIIDRANPLFYSGAVLLVFFSLLSLSWPVVVLWSCAIGVLGAYLLFRNRQLAPNLLLHLKPVVIVQDEGQEKSQPKCPVCGDLQCFRHPMTSSLQNDMMPWKGLKIPETIDKSLTQFLNIVIERFVTSWHSQLTGAHIFTNEARVLIRHAVCLFLHRVTKMDIPKLVTGPLLQTLVEHIHLYVSVRRRMLPNATPQAIEQEIWRTLGSTLHVAMRGKTANFRYFRNLTRTALPLLLTTESANSRVLCRFLEELLATKVMIPAMDYVSTPDFLNKIVILIFDKESKLTRLPYPASKSVPILEEFARPRCQDRLQPHINEILKSSKLLYPFMQYLKRQDSVQILEFYMTCDDLRKKIASTDMGTSIAQNASVFVDQVQQLYDLYISPSSDGKVILDPSIVQSIERVLLADVSDLTKVIQLTNDQVLDEACHEVMLTLQKVFCFPFYHSKEFFEAMFPILTAQTRRSITTADVHSLSRHFEKWRSQRKKRASLKSYQEPMTNAQPEQQVPSRTQRSDSSPILPNSSVYSSSPTLSNLEESLFGSTIQVQIVDWEVISNAIKPYTIYTIVAKHEDEDGKCNVTKVRRRYKEFVVLDSRIHQFYRNVSVYLPPKRAFHNMEKQFIESRMKDLESYLQKLVQEPEIQNSQLLRSFLSDKAEVGLFMPETVGDKAGKIIKSLKKEPKGQHLDALLQSMDNNVATTPRKPCPKKQAETENQENQNNAIIEKYNQAIADDASTNDPIKKSWLQTPSKLGDPVTLNGVMDLLVYLAIHVYRVSHPQLSSLLAIKMLAQSSIDAFFYDLLSNRVELMCQEHKVCELIELLQDELFLNKSPPRTQEDRMERKETALNTVLTRPPEFLVSLIGVDTFISNTTLLLDGLQSQELNKHMLFSMLDVIVWELFPELRT